MEFRRFENTYVIRMDRGEEVVATLTALCRQEGIRLASVEAIGAVDRAVVGLYDVDKKVFHRKEFQEPMELTSLLGTVTEKDGKPYLHLHITASRRDYTCIGGHLLTAYINGACELYVEAFPGVFVGRYADPATGINLYQF